jgi:hypothetical protein
MQIWQVPNSKKLLMKSAILLVFFLLLRQLPKIKDSVLLSDQNITPKFVNSPVKSVNVLRNVP